MVEFYEVFFSNGAYRAVRCAQPYSNNADFVVEVFKGNINGYKDQDISLKIYTRGSLADIVIRDWTFTYCLTGNLHHPGRYSSASCSIEGKSKNGLVREIFVSLSTCSVEKLIVALFSRMHILSYCDDPNDYDLFANSDQLLNWGNYIYSNGNINLLSLRDDIERLYKMGQAVAKYSSNPEVAESNFYKEIASVFVESQKRLATLLSAQV